MHLAQAPHTESRPEKPCWLPRRHTIAVVQHGDCGQRVIQGEGAGVLVASRCRNASSCGQVPPFGRRFRPLTIDLAGPRKCGVALVLFHVEMFGTDSREC